MNCFSHYYENQLHRSFILLENLLMFTGYININLGFFHLLIAVPQPKAVCKVLNWRLYKALLVIKVPYKLSYKVPYEGSYKVPYDKAISK